MSISQPIKQRPVWIIYDPYVSIRYLYDILHDEYDIIAVLTPLALDKDEIEKRFDPSFFKEVLRLSGQLERDVEFLKSKFTSLNIYVHISGFEKNLDYIEKLIYAFEPEYSNNPNTSRYRKHKGGMQDGMKQAGLPCLQHINLNRFYTFEELIPLTADFQFPLIIKPAESAGSIGVSICPDLQTIEKKLRTTLNQPAMFGIETHEVILEEYVSGLELVADAASWKGQHLITGLFKYRKINYAGIPLYRTIDMLEEQDDSSRYCAYIESTLDALGVRSGLSHTEIMDTTSGLRLLELNMRISGAYGFINHLTKALYGMDQIDALQILRGSIKQASCKPSYQHGKLFFLQNFGFTYKAIDTSKLTGLPSHNRHQILHPYAEIFKEPQSLIDTVTLVLLLHDDSQVIEKDIETLMEYEKTGEIFCG